MRARRNPARRLTWARSSASTSGSGLGNTAATSRANACPARVGSPSPMSTRSVNGRSSRHAASGSRAVGAVWSCSSGRSRIARSNDSSARRASPSGTESTSRTKPSLFSAPDDARPFDAVAERDEKTLLPAARSVAQNLQRLTRAIGINHLATRLYREMAPPRRSISGVAPEMRMRSAVGRVRITIKTGTTQVRKCRNVTSR